MASLATYAKLTCTPNQFRPEEDIKFRLQYSQDLVTARGTLYIDGTRWDSESAEATQILDTAIGGQWLAEWNIPGGTLATSPSEGDISYMGGKVQAYVEIWVEETNQNQETTKKVIWTSNIVLVDMLMMWDWDLYFASPSSIFEVHEYHTNKSSCTVGLSYIPRHDFGVSGDNNIQGYRFYLYDSGYNLIFDSGELYDWDSNIYGTTNYTFFDLKDNSTYYLKARVSLNGGYVMYRPSAQDAYVPIYVNYSDTPVISKHLVLESTPAGVKCTLDETVDYTSYTVTRTAYNESDYISVGTVAGTGSYVVDKYAIPKKHYIYKAVVYNGSSIVGTYYNEIEYTSNSIKISDVFGCYTALGDITKHPISRNDRGAVLEAMDSVFPYNIINGAPNYDMGSVDGLFSDLDDDCTVITDSDYLAAKSDILRAWLNNGRAKLLTYYTGEAWIVTVKGIQTTDPDNNDVYHTVFNWTQIGNANRMTEYVRLGLLINNQ